MDVHQDLVLASHRSTRALRNSGVTVSVSGSSLGSIPHCLKYGFGSIPVLSGNERISPYSFIFLHGFVGHVWREVYL